MAIPVSGNKFFTGLCVCQRHPMLWYMFALVSYYYFRFWSMCTSTLHLTLISEVCRCRFDCSRTWNARQHCSSLWYRSDICSRFWVITTSVLYMMVFSCVVTVLRCRCWWTWIGRTQKIAAAVSLSALISSVLCIVDSRTTPTGKMTLANVNITFTSSLYHWFIVGLLKVQGVI